MQAIVEKGQGLPHHLDSSDATEPQAPGGPPRIGSWMWNGRAGRENAGKKEGGRQAEP